MTDKDEGSCRFRCRTQREAFMAGWDAANKVLDEFPESLGDIWDEERLKRKAWLGWRRSGEE